MKKSNQKINSIQRAIGFRFKETSSEADIDSVVKALRDMKGIITEIRSLQGGRNISSAGRDKGFTHLFVLSFDCMADLESYANHPAHMDFVQVLLPHLADSIELDSHLS